MTNTLSFSRKNIVSLLLGLMLTLSMFGFGTINASATGSSIGDVNISLGEDGKLSVSGGGMSHDSSSKAWNAFLTKYKTFIVGISGVGAISMIAFFIFQFMKLGATASNPSERAKVQVGLIWSALAAAGLGAVSIIVGFFYSSLK